MPPSEGGLRSVPWRSQFFELHPALPATISASMSLGSRSQSRTNSPAMRRRVGDNTASKTVAHRSSARLYKDGPTPRLWQRMTWRNEAGWISALQNDPTLWKAGMDRRAVDGKRFMSATQAGEFIIDSVEKRKW